MINLHFRMERKEYRAPKVTVQSLKYDSMIASSNLEDIVDGDEWEWED